jgi:hypothetical protein
MYRRTDKPARPVWRFALTAQEALASLESAAPELPRQWDDAPSHQQLGDEAEASADAVVAQLTHACTLEETQALLSTMDDALWGMMALAQRPQVRALAELVVRHHDALDAADPGSPGAALSWLELYDRHWFDELVLLMVTHGLDPDVLFGVLPDPCDLGARYPQLGTQLARALADSSATQRTRLAAASWLGTGDWPQATGALQAALREPRLGLRCAALQALVRFKHLAPQDTKWLLEDAVARHRRVGTEALHFPYTELLAQAVTLAPCDDAPQLLQHLHSRGEAHPVAARALATNFPREAVALLWGQVHSFDPASRARGVEDLSRLPPALAAPLLASLCQDPVPEVAQAARDTWLDQHHATPPARGPIPGQHLLPGGGSTRFTLRVTLLQQQSVEARRKVVQAVVDERPRGAARTERALLLLLAACDPELEPPSSRDRADHFSSIALELCRALGGRLVDVVLQYAERFPISGYPGWGALLKHLHQEALLKPAHRARVHALASSLLQGQATARLGIDLLLSVGVPAPLLGPLLAVDERGGLGARLALRNTPRSRAFGRALLSQLEQALSARDWRVVYELVLAALEHEVPGLERRLGLALKVGRDDANPMLGWLLRLMHERELLPVGAFERALRGGTVEAQWALDALPVDALSDEVRHLVLAALEGPLVVPAARAALAHHLLAADDRAWSRHLKRLPAQVADELLVLLARKEPRRWARQVVKALARAGGASLQALCAVANPRVVRRAAASRPAEAPLMLTALGERLPEWLDEEEPS